MKKTRRAKKAGRTPAQKLRALGREELVQAVGGQSSAQGIGTSPTSPQGIGTSPSSPQGIGTSPHFDGDG